MSRFLRNPALFPARMSGEPWGDERVVVDLPAGPYAIHGLSQEQASSLRDRYREAVPSGDCFEIAIFRAAQSDFVEADGQRNYELEIHGPVIAGFDLMARVGPNAAAIWTAVTARDTFFGVVENVLRPLIARRLLDDGGLLVHSASVVIGDDGFLFPGRSGAGKSTISSLAIATGLPVLSDDLNAVRDHTILPVPFAGNLAPSQLRTTPAPLRAIVALEQGSYDGLRPMSVAETIALLVRCAPYVNLDGSFADALLDRAHDLSRTVRAGVLTFRRQGDVWPILTSWRT